MLGLNDLNIEEEEDFPASSSSSRARRGARRAPTRIPGRVPATPTETVSASNPGLDAIDREALDLDPDVHLGEGIMFE